MPSWGSLNYRDSLRWVECMRKAAAGMIADGWNKHARKFHRVQLKRAVRLYHEGGKS